MGKTTNSKYLEMKDKITKLKEEALKVAKETFNDGAKELFEKHPDLTSFGWRQFTQNFNDGDTCHFYAHTDYPLINEIDLDRDELDEDVDTSILEKLEESVKEFLSVFDNDDLKDLFDDHVEVTVTKEGATTSSYYDHD